ncbi:MAG TPA: alanine--tRNA ligase [Gammaproteobacteria bacterium]|nr:alanine--tRNA ligase [Gammaproteobacteria bacterium]
MEVNKIRKLFIKYFEERGHKHVESSPLVPQGKDQSLLFTNAGMVQFKDVFLGNDSLAYNCAVSSQRCLRAGGKHNDLENVGHTARHHTFFEMLGNFSFGDYFKEQAIHYAWEFLTLHLKLPKDKLWVTVYKDDDEAYNIWKDKVGFPEDKIIRCGEIDNFWSMGDTGPCGPCSEIFFDHGPDVAGGPPGSEDQDGDRFVEIWNMVFMQYNRDNNGLQPLPKPSVDTGMGLERIAAVMQGVHSNYDIDHFQYLQNQLFSRFSTVQWSRVAGQVISDHIRAICFLLADFVYPSNEGRGYVLRRILRRAVRYGYQCGQKDPFLHQLVDDCIHLYQEVCPQLVNDGDRIKDIILSEEVSFYRTIEQGMLWFDKYMQELTTDTLSGDKVFKLYDTYGFPIDLTAMMAKERDVDIDEEGFQKCLQDQKSRSQKSQKFKTVELESYRHLPESEFLGYDQSEVVATIIAMNEGEGSVEAGQDVAVVLDQTPFYAESGGQVGDCGWIYGPAGLMRVTETQKSSQSIVHYGRVEEGVLTTGESIRAVIDDRQAIVRNHSATHLLHAALRLELGDHLVQKGSLVDAGKLRFDFSCPKALTKDQLNKIEVVVNHWVQRNFERKTQTMSLEQAKDSGAIALFGEKYDENVRVVSFGPISTELCGGTHVDFTGDIGFFSIVSESSVSAGIRRIEAITALEALARFQKSRAIISDLTTSMSVKEEGLLDKFKQMKEEIKGLKKSRVEKSEGVEDWIKEETVFNRIGWLVRKVEAEPGLLRMYADKIRSFNGDRVIILMSAKDKKYNVLCTISHSLKGLYSAKEILNVLINFSGGRGGGKDTLAQGVLDTQLQVEGVKKLLTDWVKSNED